MNDLVPGGQRDFAALREEVQRRADRGMPPLGGISADDARAALAQVENLDRDAWARAWSAVAAKYEDEAQAQEPRDRARAAKAWWNAWRLHHFARWPTENTPLKRDAKARALE